MLQRDLYRIMWQPVILTFVEGTVFISLDDERTAQFLTATREGGGERSRLRDYCPRLIYYLTTSSPDCMQRERAP